MKSLKATLFTLVLFVAIGSAAVKAQPHPTDQQLRTYYSLFNEYARNQDWNMAVTTIGNVRKYLPSIMNLPQLKDFRPLLAKRMIDTYKGAAALPATTSDKKVAYLDSVATLYLSLPRVLKSLGTEVDMYQWTFDRGYFLQNNSADLPPRYRTEIVPTYLQAFELNPEKLGDYYKIFILKSMIEAGNKEEALAFGERLRPYLSNEQSIQALDGHINNMFSNPSERITFLEGQIKKNPRDVAKTDELFRLYNRYTSLKGKADTLVTNVMTNLLPDSTITLTTTLYNAIGAKVFNNDETQITAALVYFHKATSVAKEPFEIRSSNYVTGLMNLSQQNFEEAYQNAVAIIGADSSYAGGYALLANTLKAATAALENPTPEEKLAYYLVIQNYDKAIMYTKPDAPSSAGDITAYSEAKADAARNLPAATVMRQKSWVTGTQLAVGGRLAWATALVTIP